MPRLLTLDWETYYDREYSLSKMTTEEYVRSQQFQPIGCAFKWGDGATEWVAGPKNVVSYLLNIDWSDVIVVCQNTAFDGFILSQLYRVQPLAWIDIMGMSRALFPHEKSHSLKSQAERMGIGAKGDEVVNALGKRYADFTPEQLDRYGAYCINDVELTHTLFTRYLAMGFPQKELKLIDLTLRMFVEPVLELDKSLLESHLTEVRSRKQALLERVRDSLLQSADPDTKHAVLTAGLDGVKTLLMSNPKFAEALKGMGVEPPTKISQTTGKETYAFAKSDEEFKALEEHPSDDVQALVAARLGNKSTLEETRTERFIGMATRGKFPVPLRYYGAHSGRWSGEQSVNLQNLPSRGANAGKIKKAIMAPEGYVVIDCDSAQIEARVLAWLAGQTDLVEAFRNKQDVYKLMASKIYGVPVEEITPVQRQVGKTVVLGCFGPDTPVLTTRGWIPIIHVQATDKVWDGLRWVSHAGVIPQGEKDVWTAHGISATSDHEILTERGWAAWSEVIENPSLWKSARSVANLLSLSGAHIRRPEGGDLDGTLFADVRAGGKASSFGKTYSKAVALGVTLAPKLRRILNGIGHTKAFVQTRLLALGCSTVYRPALQGATTQAARRTTTTADAAYTYTNRGEQTASRSLRTYLTLKGMTNKVWSLTGLMSIKDMSRAIFASWGVQPTWQIGAASEHYKRGSQPLKQRMQTYDIAYAGPRNRYTILTDDGPIVVHNCGYGVGHVKLQNFLKVQAGVEVSLVEAKRIIDTYRTASDKIAAFWARAGKALTCLLQGQKLQVDAVGVCTAIPDMGITLPSGLHIQYPDLRKQLNSDGSNEFVYTSKGLPIRIYGGKVVENLCQAVARQVVAEQMLRVSKRYRVVLTVHDAVAIVAPESEAAEAQAYLEECMSWNPAWAVGLPLSCESGVGKSYGDC